jgi:hypothetical protein
MMSLFKPGTDGVLNVSHISSGDASKYHPQFNLSMFLDEEETGAKRQETGALTQNLRRTTTASSAFADCAARTFEACVFESRKVCLRQIMKCICSTQLSKDPMQPVESIHAEHGTFVLQIVQVVTLDFL